jgi:hypothetical protein
MILIPHPWTRVNDNWIYNDSVDATPVLVDIKHVLVSSPPSNIDNINFYLDKTQDRYNCNFYKNIALDIVSETVFNYPYPYISEKTLRPIANKRMFIVVGPKNVLQLLKSKGFETFPDYIDESYDDIDDPIERFNNIIESIDIFISQPMDDIKNYYRKNQDRFDHNFQLLTQLEENELENICKKYLK